MKYLTAFFLFLFLAISLFSENLSEIKKITDTIDTMLAKMDFKAPKKILILPVENLGGLVAINTTELYAEVNNRIFNDTRFKIVDRNILDKVIAEQKLQMTGLVNTDTAVSVGSLTGAQMIFSTRIEQGTIEFKIVSVETTELLSYMFVKISDDKQYHGGINEGALEIRTGWVLSQDYQKYFNEKLRFGYYPVEVKGRNQNGLSQYYGVYRKNIIGIKWATYHGMTDDVLIKRKKEMGAKGYKQVYSSLFVDSAGLKRNIGIWHKK